MPYDAFISYARGEDGRVAFALRNGLHQFAKKVFSIRAVRVFLDTTSLDVAGELPERLTKALETSKHLILIASPASASSKWVNKEIEVWSRQHNVSNLIIVLTDGELEFNPSKKAFDSRNSTAAPKALVKLFSREPLWLDGRDLRNEKDLSLSNSAVKLVVAKLSARIRNYDLDSLYGEDIDQAKRLRKYRNVAITGLVLLTVTSVIAAIFAELSRRSALDEAFRSHLLTEAAIVRADLGTDALKARNRVGDALDKNLNSKFSILREVHESALLAFDRSRELDTIDSPRNSKMIPFFAVRDIISRRGMDFMVVLSDNGVLFLNDSLELICPPIKPVHLGHALPTTMDLDHRGEKIIIGGKVNHKSDDNGTAHQGWLEILNTSCDNGSLEKIYSTTFRQPVDRVRWGNETAYVAKQEAIVELSGNVLTELIQLPKSHSTLGFFYFGREMFFLNGIREDIGLDETTETLGELRAINGKSNYTHKVLQAMGGNHTMTELSGDWFAVGNELGALDIWRYTIEDIEKVHQRNLFNMPVTSIAESKDRRYLAVSSEGGEIAILRKSTGAILFRFQTNRNSVLALEWLTNGYLLSSDNIGNIQVWDFTDLTYRHDNSLKLTETFLIDDQDGKIRRLVVTGEAVKIDSGRKTLFARERSKFYDSEERITGFDVSESGDFAVLTTGFQIEGTAPLSILNGGKPNVGKLEFWRKGNVEIIGKKDLQPSSVAIDEHSHFAVGYGFGVHSEEMVGLLDVLEDTISEKEKKSTSGKKYAREAAAISAARKQLRSGLAVFDNEGKQIVFHDHFASGVVDLVEANPYGHTVSFASTWGRQYIQLWKSNGQPHGDPIKIIEDEENLRRIYKIAFFDNGDKLAVSTGPVVDVDDSNVKFTKGNESEHRLAIYDLNAQTTTFHSTVHRWPVEHFAMSEQDRVFVMAGSGMPERGERILSVWSYDGAAIYHRIALSDKPVKGLLIKENGTVLVTEQGGGQREIPILARALVQKFIDRGRTAKKNLIAQNILERAEKSKNSNEALMVILEMPSGAAANGELKITRARALEQVGKIQEASNAWKEAVIDLPYDWIVHYLRGEFALRNQEFELAVQAFTKAEQYYQLSPLHRPLQDGGSDILSLNAVSESNSNQLRVNLLSKLAYSQCKNGNTDQAIITATHAANIGFVSANISSMSKSSIPSDCGIEP